jgi:hypothetical protein
MQNNNLVALVVLVVLLSLGHISTAAGASAEDAKLYAGLAASDWIQIANVMAVSATLIVIARQVQVANKLAKAQILKDRFEMYWRVTQTPIDKAQIEAIRADPARSYMDLKRFNEYYSSDDAKLRDYLEYGKLYEYLAFLFALRSMGVEDPLGPDWLPKWLADLVRNQEFLDVNEQYKSYYPDFSNYLAKIVQKK